MRPAALGMRPPRTVVGLATAVLLLSGCGGQGATGGSAVTAGKPAAGEDASRVSSTAEQVAGAPDASSASPTKEPSLPPGDPGLDAPSAPDPGARGAKHHAGHEAARRTVPVSAMLTAGTVRSVLGGGWSAHPGGGDECVRPTGARGARSMSYGGTDAGLVVETVATYRDAGRADAAAEELGDAAVGCGWKPGADPRLGSASVAATDGERSMVAVSTEGVVVLLVGTGDVARDAGRWGSLVDLALGTSCPAAPDGCH